MKIGTQSRSSLLIWNIFLKIADLDPKLGRFGLKIAICSKIYEVWHLVHTEHASSEYGTELMILTQNYRFGQIMSQHWNLLRFLSNYPLTTNRTC